MPRRRSHLPKFLEAHELTTLIEAAQASSPRDHALVLVMAYAGLRVAEACALRWADVEGEALYVAHGKGDKSRYVPIHPRLRKALSQLVGQGHSQTLRIPEKTTEDSRIPATDAASRTTAGHSLSLAELESHQELLQTSDPPLRFCDTLRTSPIFTGRGGKPLTTRAAELILLRLCAEAGIPREKAHPHALRHTAATRLLRETGNILLVQKFLGHSSIATTQIYTHLVLDDLSAAIGRLA